MVRLGATDVPHTPQLVMRHRSPQELKALQNAVESGWARRVTEPIMGVAEKGIQKLPKGKVQTLARKGARLMAEDPLGNALTNLSPIPGTNPAYLGMKKGLEHAIDKLVPLPA